MHAEHLSNLKFWKKTGGVVVLAFAASLLAALTSGPLGGATAFDWLSAGDMALRASVVALLGAVVGGSVGDPSTPLPVGPAPAP